MGKAGRVISVYSPDGSFFMSYDDDDEYPIQVLMDQGRLILRRPVTAEHELEGGWRHLRTFQLLANYAAGYSIQVEKRTI